MDITQFDVPDEHRFIYGVTQAEDPNKYIKRLAVRADVPLGSLARTFTGTYPAAPKVTEGKTAITGGYEFGWAVSRGHSVKGYNVYRSAINNAAVATFLQFVPNPPPADFRGSVTYQDITAIAAPFYWVASVNSGGKESVRIPMTGATSPVASPAAPSEAGGGSGANSGGGMVGNNFDLGW